MTGPKPKAKRRDPLLEAADAIEHGQLTHDYLRGLWGPEALAAAHQQDVEEGPLAAVGLGMARGASFGLGDLAQRLLLTDAERKSVAATTAQHPHLTTAGTVAGAALPFLLTGGAAGPEEAGILGGTRATLPGLGAAATRTAIGAAQGVGLTPGSLQDRAVGGVVGGLGARYAPAIAGAAGKVAGRLPLVGGIFRTAGGAVPIVARSAAPAAAEGLLPSGITETAARASLAKQGFPPDIIEQALARARAPTPPQGLLSEIPGSGGQGFEVTGSRATPPAPTAPTVAEMTRPTVGPRQPGLLSSLGRGEQFPYYTRGGAAEQAIAPFPTPSGPPSSSLIPMQQLQMLLRLSPEEFEAAGGLFPKAIMDQLRQLRLANPGLLAATP